MENGEAKKKNKKLKKAKFNYLYLKTKLISRTLSVEDVVCKYIIVSSNFKHTLFYSELEDTTTMTSLQITREVVVMKLIIPLLK